MHSKHVVENLEDTAALQDVRRSSKRSDLLTYDQTDADLSQAQQKSGYLKELANDVRPDPTN